MVTNPAGTVTSSSAPLAVNALERARLVNMSIRTQAGAGAQTLIVGFGIRGGGTGGTKPLLLRAIGPTLAQFGVGGALADPQLTLRRQQTVLASNNDWSGDALANVFSQAGAFALPVGSRDAALQPTLENGSYSVQISGDGATGIALAEIYDVTPPAAVTAAMPRLT